MPFDLKLKDWLPLIGAGGVLGIGATLRGIWVGLGRSRLLHRDALDLPQIPASSVIYEEEVPSLDRLLVGRDADTETVTALVQGNSLVLLDGSSGVGKSTLLKLGVARSLMRTGPWLPVYVDIWGSDWIAGPTTYLADALQVALEHGLGDAERQRLALDTAVTEANLWDILERLRSVCGRRPVLIFDQMDGYQSNHWQRFLGPDGALLSTAALLDLNPFWSAVCRLCRAGSCHVLFAVRRDAGTDLNPLHFQEPKTRHLLRLTALDVRSFIDRLIPADQVSHPDNGFEQLKERIALDLEQRGAETGVLAIQMRVVLSGLSALRRLTPRDLDKAGGVAGLEAAYVESYAQRALGGRSTALRVLLLLVKRSAETVQGTVARSLAELAEGSGLSAETLGPILELFEGARIVLRRFDRQRGEVWQLYHDYLTRAVVALDRKDRESQLLLSEHASAFEKASGLGAKIRALLSLSEQLHILRDRLRGRLVYRPFRSYAILSTARLLLNATLPLLVLALGAIVFAIHERSAEIQKDQARIATDRLTEAQAALRRYDLAGAVAAFGSALDYLPPSDPRASAALAGLLANLPSAPRLLHEFQSVWGAALSVDANKVLVRRQSGRVETFEGTTGKELPSPTIGTLYNDFQWQNFLEPNPVVLSADGSVAALAFPAESFTAAARSFPLTLAAWRPGTDKVIWHERSDDDRIMPGPGGYFLLRGTNSSTILRPRSENATGITRFLRIRADRAEELTLSDGRLVPISGLGQRPDSVFAPTGDPYIVWSLNGPESRLVVVNLDKIQAGYSGPPPANARILTCTGRLRPEGFLIVTWLGSSARPALRTITVARVEFGKAGPSPTQSEALCDEKGLRPDSPKEYPGLTYSTPPTTGARGVDEGLFFSSSFGWAPTPGRDTVSVLQGIDLHVHDLKLQAELPIRRLGRLQALVWDRAGDQAWGINDDGRLIAVPIFSMDTPRSVSRATDQVNVRLPSPTPPPTRSFTVESSAAGLIEISSTPVGRMSSGARPWKESIPWSGQVEGGPWVSRDGEHVFVVARQGENDGTVVDLDAQSGHETTRFGTIGWRLDDGTWCNGTRCLGVVTRLVDQRWETAVCDWSVTDRMGRLGSCSPGLEGRLDISRDGQFFVQAATTTTAIYSTNDLGERQAPLLKIAGPRTREQFGRALTEFLVRRADSLVYEEAKEQSELQATLHGNTFVASFANGTISFKASGRELHFPPDAFVNPSAELAHFLTPIAISQGGERLIVFIDPAQEFEVWDISTGTLLALLPRTANWLTFSDSGDSVQILTASQPVEVLYLGPPGADRPAWASGAAMTTFLGGPPSRDWKSLDDVLTAIRRESDQGSPVSGRVVQMLRKAWRFF